MVEPMTVAKSVLTLKGAFDKHFETQQRDWLEKCRDEALGVAQAAAIGVLSAMLGQRPTDPEVQALLADIVNERSFPARSLRALSEVVRSPAEVRRRRLVAVLIAGPKITASEADRDRLDLLAEQLMEEDIVSLKAIVKGVGRALNGSWPLGFDVERPSPDSHYRVIVNTQPVGVEVNRISFDRLAGAHCVARLSVSWTQVTALGEFLVQHMDHEAIRAGVGSVDASEAE
jgi:hypothetical protein